MMFSAGERWAWLWEVTTSRAHFLSLKNARRDCFYWCFCGALPFGVLFYFSFVNCLLAYFLSVWSSFSSFFHCGWTQTEAVTRCALFIAKEFVWCFKVCVGWVWNLGRKIIVWRLLEFYGVVVINERFKGNKCLENKKGEDEIS